jgi:hypothetical protein
MLRGALLFLLIVGCLVTVARGDILQQQVQKWVNASTLTFTGTIVKMGASNVSGMSPHDFPMIVRMEKIEAGDDQALKKFGSLKDTELTVIVGSLDRNGLRNNVSAVFFVDPLVYETNIGVIANAIAFVDQKTSDDFSKWLSAAALRKSEAPLRSSVVSADLILAGVVQEIRPLASAKAAYLKSVDNGREIFSEHRPGWEEAVIHVKSVEKGKPPETLEVIVVFPGSRDPAWTESPKYETGQVGIWLLHTNQLRRQEAEALLKPEQFHGHKVQSFTTLDPADFQDEAKLDRIREMINEAKR